MANDPTPHPRTLADVAFHQELEKLLAWREAWYAAWEWCEVRAQCDSVGSREYARVTDQAWLSEVQPNQTEMRNFIGMRCNLAPAPSVTEESLERRRQRLLRRLDAEPLD